MKHDVRVLKIFDENKKLSEIVNEGKVILDDCDAGCRHKVVKIWSGIACKVCGGSLNIRI